MAVAKCNAYIIDYTPIKNPSMADTIKLANTLRVKIQRLAEKKDTTIFAIIGVSEEDGSKGTYVSIKIGKKGRPVRKFSNGYDEHIVQPHIHILIYGYLANTISENIKEYLEKKYGTLDSTKITVFRKECKYFKTKLFYIYKQVRYIRSLTMIGSKYYFDVSFIKQYLIDIQSRLEDFRISITLPKNDDNDLHHSKNNIVEKIKTFIFTKIKQSKRGKDALFNGSYKYLYKSKSSLYKHINKLIIRIEAYINDT